MKRAIILMTAIACAAMPAMAQNKTGIAGRYTGSGEGDLTAIIIPVKDDIYKLSISTGVPMRNGRPGCGGGIDGEAILQKTGGNFFVENEDYDPKEKASFYNKRYCEIGLTFDGKGRLKLEERDGCISYHGASCSFTGTLKYKGPVK